MDARLDSPSPRSSQGGGSPPDLRLAPERLLARPEPRTPGLGPEGSEAPSEVMISLTWVGRLRWLAFAGQSGAILLSSLWLEMDLPLLPLLVLVSTTAVSNLALIQTLGRLPVLPRLLVPAVLLFDVILLTGLLALTGGPRNPFCELYLVHVAMAAVLLGARGTWAIVLSSLTAYLLLFPFHLPLVWKEAGNEDLLIAGHWMALALTSGLVAYFLGKLRSALRSRDRQVAAMRQDVLRSEQLASLTTLAAGAAHELGSPLATIAVVARELEREAEKGIRSGRAVEDVRLIRSEVDRCRRILDRMHLGGAQGRDEQPERLSFEELVEILREEVGEAAFDALDLHLRETDEEIEIHPVAWAQTAQILIQNAIEAGSEGGEAVRLELEVSAESLRVEVTDHGEGMSPEQLDRTGEPFVTTKSPRHGMGLGLYLARLLAEHHGARLSLRSRPGVGTRAELVWPTLPGS